MKQRALQLPISVIDDLPEDSVKWSTVSLSEVFDKKLRLEASVYDIKGKQAREILSNCRWELKTITGENGLSTAYRPPICKRIFVDKGGIPMFTPSQITEVYPKPLKFISPKTKTDLSSWYLKEGEIVLTCSGSIGDVSYISQTLQGKLFSQNMIRIVPKTQSGYIYAFLKSDIGQTLLQTNNYGGVISHIDPEHLDEIPIPNPQALIKIEIHNFIIKSFALRDESNALIDEAENLLIKELKLPPLSELSSNFIDTNQEIPNFEIKLSELSGRIEASFHKPLVNSIYEHIKKYADEVTTLGDSRISSNIILPSRFKRVYVSAGQGVLFFGGKELLQLTPDGEKFLSLTHHSNRIKKELTLEENMIMVTCSGTVGKVAIVPKHWQGWTANQHILRIIPTNNEIAGYIYAWLNTDYGKELVTRFIYGAVVNEIDHHQLKQVKIPLLKNNDVQQEINNLILEANQKRYEAYLLEQKAIQTINEKVIYS